jgi:methylated-DNA-[protein]-cysteine S-methyltransferase
MTAMIGPTDAVWTTMLGSPVGTLLCAANDAGVRAVWFVDDPADRARLEARLRRPLREGDHPHLRALRAWLEAYFAGDGAGLAGAPPLEPEGTAFQRAAWEALRSIPPGSTRTYAQQARAIGRPSAVRAVGAANGANPIALLLPCHRVIGAGGGLTGYGGGLDRKRWLLDHERAMAGLFGVA